MQLIGECPTKQRTCRAGGEEDEPYALKELCNVSKMNSVFKKVNLDCVKL